MPCAVTIYDSHPDSCRVASIVESNTKVKVIHRFLRISLGVIAPGPDRHGVELYSVLFLPAR